MGWLDRLVTPKSVQEVLDEQDKQHQQLERTIQDYYDLRGLQEAEQLLQGKK